MLIRPERQPLDRENLLLHFQRIAKSVVARNSEYHRLIWTAYSEQDVFNNGYVFCMGTVLFFLKGCDANK
jgi:hypothetical protein